MRRARSRMPQLASAARYAFAAFAAFAVMGVLSSVGCVDTAGPVTEAADVRGSWRFTADQAAPSLQLEGTLVIQSQRGDLITGTISWEERDGAGGVRLDGGALSGRVIDRSDVDFDVLLPAGSRRHVARLSTDTMQGSWLQIASGRSGAFRAVRAAAGGTP